VLLSGRDVKRFGFENGWNEQRLGGDLRSSSAFFSFS
jgi:hypothetical protein